DLAGGLHAGQVLDGTRDAQADVEVRRDVHAGLADLELGVVVAQVDGVTGGAHSAAQHVGEPLDDVVEGLLGAHAAPAGDDDLGLRQLGAGAAGGRGEGGDGDVLGAGGRQRQVLQGARRLLRQGVDDAGAQRVDGAGAADDGGDLDLVAEDG